MPPLVPIPHCFDAATITLRMRRSSRLLASWQQSTGHDRPSSSCTSRAGDAEAQGEPVLRPRPSTDDPVAGPRRSAAGWVRRGRQRKTEAGRTKPSSSSWQERSGGQCAVHGALPLLERTAAARVEFKFVMSCPCVVQQRISILGSVDLLDLLSTVRHDTVPVK
jgi:hypothetical protein